MSTITKLESGIGHTKSGKPIPCYRITKIKPNKYRPEDSTYKDELEKKNQWLKSQEQTISLPIKGF